MSEDKNSLVKGFKSKEQREDALAKIKQEVVAMTPQEKLESLLDQRAWQLLQSLLTWGVMWEKVRRGDKLPYDETTQNIMLAPFSFFGTNAAIWGVVSQRVIPILMHYVLIYQSDEMYAKANPMPWVVLQVAAPELIGMVHGPAGIKEANKIIAELKKADELPV